MDDQLKPCPFCGKDVEQPIKQFKGEVWSFIHRCPVVGVIAFERYSFEHIVQLWNTRPNEDTPRTAALRTVAD